MTPRQYLIDARKAKGMSREDAARRLRISVTLYSWLENDDQIITHPHFADRIRRLFHLTNKQRNSMVNIIHYI